MWFNVTVENLASVNYSAILGFSLNDTQYQAQFATFSNEEYNVVPGTQTLTAWLSVASEAPPGNFLITVNVTRQGEGVPPSQDSPLTLPKISLAPSLELLGNGARWAAGNGTSALVINWKDNYLAHNQTDGADWGPWPEEATMNNWSQSIQQALENTGSS